MGDWMYGVDSAVHPAYQSKGIGALLMEARFDVLRRLNLRGLIAGSMIMGYGAVAHEISPDAYMREVVEGKRFDNNLSKQLKKGFRALNVIPDYVYDPRTLNYAVAIMWENPDYNPALGVLPTSVLHLPVAKPQPARTRRRSTMRLPVIPPVAAVQTATMRAIPPTA